VKTSAAPAKNVAPAKNAAPGASIKNDVAAKPAKVAAQEPAKAPAAISQKPAQKAPARSAVAAKPKNTAAKSTSGSASAGAIRTQEVRMPRRDPFESLVGRNQKDGNSGPKLPGKAGLVISTLRLDGVVRSPSAMIAVVSNPQQRTYFLREGDQLYDGRVEKISMDGVSFHENGKDAFGKPVERQVNKRIYPSSGEQQ
jgi:Tfp pilus assembly protein PilP